jgi:hypothetical protein
MNKFLALLLSLCLLYPRRRTNCIQHWLIDAGLRLAQESGFVGKGWYFELVECLGVFLFGELFLRGFFGDLFLFGFGGGEVWLYHS